jgi:hypothetical protein
MAGAGGDSAAGFEELGFFALRCRFWGRSSSELLLETVSAAVSGSELAGFLKRAEVLLRGFCSVELVKLAPFGMNMVSPPRGHANHQCSLPHFWHSEGGLRVVSNTFPLRDT